MKRRYQVKQWDPAISDQLTHDFGIDRSIAKLLQNRNVIKKEQVRNYLNTDLSFLNHPFDIQGMYEAVKLVGESVKAGKKVFLYGDYDADGVTSTAQLVLILKAIQADYDYHLPNRESDGYGLNHDAIDNIIASGAHVLVTLDCGISNYDEIQFAVDSGLEVIVIDHHKESGTLPLANVIVNPHVSEEGSRFRHLCGAGLAFNFVRGMIEWEGLSLDLSSFIQLAAIGTVADIVPLIDTNRIIVKNGLNEINNNPLPGIQQLLALSNVDLGTITSDTLAYNLAPKLNAAGRMETADIALALLVSDDILDASQLSVELTDFNHQRKEIEKNIFMQAEVKIQNQRSNKMLIVQGDQWHEGVIGIVSSRITEKYHKPSLVFSKSGKHYKGSGRSIPGFNLYEAIQQVEYLTVKSGGHPQAVGLTIEEKNFQRFKDELLAYCHQTFNDEDFVKEVLVDDHLDATCHIDLDTVIRINDVMEPFGLKNEKPIYLISGYDIIHHKYIGAQENHLKASLLLGASRFDLIKFNITPEDKKEFTRKNPLVGQFEVNHYNGSTTLQFNVMDMTGSYFVDLKRQFLIKIYERKLSSRVASEYKQKHPLIFENDVLSPNEKLIDFAQSNWIPTEQQLEIISKELCQHKSKIFKFEILKLVNYINKIYNISINEEMILYTVIHLEAQQQLQYKYRNNFLYIKYLF